jgi:peptide/nickel transport system permease protein
VSQSTHDPALTGAPTAAVAAGEAPPGLGEAEEPRPEGPLPSAKRLGPVFWLSVGWVGLVVFGAVFASVLPIQDPLAVNALPKLGPSLHHLLGTDAIGRDIFARIVYGSRVSLIVGFSAVGFGLLVGGTLGLIGGFYGGRVDTAIAVVMNVILAYPALVLALAVISFTGQSLLNVTLIIGVISVPFIQRIVRASVISYAQREFVLAARALGAKGRRIIVREILPNVVPAAIAFSLVGVGAAIVAEGGLAFLGLSVPLPTPTWGGMINDGKDLLSQNPGISLWPALAMFITVLALNLAGDRLRARFDIREGAI